MFDQVWSSVVSNSYEQESGTIYGYERRCIKNEHYPALISGPVSAKVSGVLYFDISVDDLELLDAFEGSYYVRKTVQIHTDNNIFAADTYILDPRYRALVSQRTWDPKRFDEEGLGEFLTSYFGFDL